MLATEIEIACTPSNAVPPDETTPMPAAEIDLTCTPSNVVLPDEMTSMPAAEIDLACTPSNAVPPVEEADFGFTLPVSFSSVYYIVKVVLILLMTFICMHWCQYEIRHFSEIEEVLSFAQENFIVANMYF